MSKYRSFPIYRTAKTLDLHLGSPKVDQQADFKVGGTQIVQGLSNVFIFQHGSCFYRVLRKKPNQNSVIFENFGTGKFVSLCKKQ